MDQSVIPSILIVLPFQKEDEVGVPTTTLSDLSGWVTTSGIKNLGKNSLGDFALVSEDPNKTKITHAGFLSYLHLCWAKEKGCVLNPSVVFNTILSTFAHNILENPGGYKHLFTTADKKVEVEYVGGIFNYERLMKSLEGVIANKDMFDLITKTTFDSDVEHSKTMRQMIFANAGVPFFSYSCTKCGIPSVRVDGSEADWQRALSATKQLRNFAPDAGYRKKQHENWIDECVDVLDNIIFHTFGTKNPAFKQMGKNREEFFSNIFHYGVNGYHGSGRISDFIVYGWGKVFHGGALNKNDSDLHFYPYHTIYVPMEDKRVNKKFVQFASLGYSTLNEATNTLEPHYCIDTYEVTKAETYQKISRGSAGSDFDF